MFINFSKSDISLLDVPHSKTVESSARESAEISDVDDCDVQDLIRAVKEILKAKKTLAHALP